MKIGVVIVTYNRLQKLKNTLDYFEKQSKLPNYLIVINNASTDGTKEYLSEWKKSNIFKKIVYNEVENIGGSGGFHDALSIALKEDADWIWVSDDDAYPYLDALEIADTYLKKNLSKVNNISAICGTVLTQNKIDLGHRRIISKYGPFLKEKKIPINYYYKESFEINEFSYVGTIINKEKLNKVGVTRKDYFLHYDDTEHSIRLSKVGKIICVPSIKVNHDIEFKQESSNDMYMFSWQKYYDYRNLLDMYKSNFPKYCFKIQYYKFRLKELVWKLLRVDINKRLILSTALQDFKYGKMGISNVYNPKNKRERLK